MSYPANFLIMLAWQEINSALLGLIKK